MRDRMRRSKLTLAFPVVLVAAGLWLFVGGGCAWLLTTSVERVPDDRRTLFDLDAVSLAGDPAPLSSWRGKVTLVVNTASECGFTPQLGGLEELERGYKARGFEVLGFPCDDFGGQEPGGPTEIRNVCRGYGVSFPLFEKCRVKTGPDQSPVFAWLSAQTGSLPGWNFGKYLVGRDGRPRAFFATTVDPSDESLRQAIEAALDEPAPGSVAGVDSGS